MTRSIWMNAWDLEGREPDQIIDSLLKLHLDGCRLGLSYHGGRMLLPGNSTHVVYEQHPGAMYFTPNAAHYGRLQPARSPLADTVELFLNACEKRNFPVQAWTVLCHNDYLGQLHPECCIENAFGERYPYALCPSHPEVQRYVLASCGEIAALPAITALDLEALSYMGYSHNSLHDKAGIALPPEATRLLSFCFCRYCRASSVSLSDPAAVRESLREFFESGKPPVVDEVLESAVLALRRKTLLGILSQLAPTPINLRFTPELAFTGGKTALSWDDVATAVQSVTLTFFGSPLEAMQNALAQLPAKRPHVDAGFVFHLPDCRNAEQIAARLRAVQEAGVDGVAFYSYSMAAPYQLNWLRSSLKDLNR